MKVRLVFDDWRNSEHESVYATEKGIELSSGCFHSGTTFEAEIQLDAEDAEELQAALDNGYRPVFRVIKEDTP